MQVTQAFINAIEDKIAPYRLNSYRQYFSCQNDAEALGVYLWNKALAAAYLPLLQAIEVTLRNSIHSAEYDCALEYDLYGICYKPTT